MKAEAMPGGKEAEELQQPLLGKAAAANADAPGVFAAWQSE